jgi:hypothetical protein
MQGVVRMIGSLILKARTRIQKQELPQYEQDAKVEESEDAKRYLEEERILAIHRDRLIQEVHVDATRGGFL